MSFLDRFTSAKGKDKQATPKKGVVKTDAIKLADKKSFAAVPSGKPSAPAKDQTAQGPAKPTLTSEVKHEAHRVLLRPVVTEKSTRLGHDRQYVFEVHPQATKADVRQAIWHLYGVKPTSVNVLRQGGRSVRFGRTYGQTIDRKKALITLPTGKTIDVFSA